MGETKTPHFYNFGIFEPITKPQNQLFETPANIQENPQTFSKNIMFYKSRNFEIHNCDIVRTDGQRKVMKIRPNKSQKS